MCVNPSSQDLSLECLESSGPWPFVTRRVFRSADFSTHVWSSRHHRKGLQLSSEGQSETVPSSAGIWFWNPRSLNWWIGCVFAIGSLFFAIASILSLSQPLMQAWHLNPLQVNAIFFAGSIPFTTAAYLQLYQAANVATGNRLARQNQHHAVIMGWRPTDIGWLSSVLQFIGTVLFNFNTFDAMLPSLNWFQQDLVVWAPNILGSILFLTSGYLAYIETCHAHWAWKPNSISWWVVFTNLLGCIGFFTAAMFAVVTPMPHPDAVTLSVVFTLLGAIGFLVGSMLMLPEATASEEVSSR